jgi:hypothetical protein
MSYQRSEKITKFGFSFWQTNWDFTFLQVNYC